MLQHILVVGFARCHTLSCRLLQRCTHIYKISLFNHHGYQNVHTWVSFTSVTFSYHRCSWGMCFSYAGIPDNRVNEYSGMWMLEYMPGIDLTPHWPRIWNQTSFTQLSLENILETGIIVQLVGHLPWMQLTKIISPTSYIVPQVPLGVILEYRPKNRLCTSLVVSPNKQIAKTTTTIYTYLLN